MIENITNNTPFYFNSGNYQQASDSSSIHSAFEQLNDAFAEVHPFVIVAVTFVGALTIYAIAQAILRLKPPSPTPSFQYTSPKHPFPPTTFNPERYAYNLKKSNSITPFQNEMHRFWDKDLKAELGSDFRPLDYVYKTYSYAKRLEAFFPIPDDAKTYIIEYRKKHPFARKPIRDACRFVLPSDDAVWNKKMWGDIITAKSDEIRWFHFLPFLPVVESYLYQHFEHYQDLKESGKSDAQIERHYKLKLKRLPKELNAPLREIFRIEYAHFSEIQSKKIAMKKTKTIANDPKFEEEAFSQFISKSRIPSNYSLRLFESVLIESYYPIVEPNLIPIAHEFFNSGVLPSYFIETLEIIYNTPKQLNNIPAITISGNEINYPGYTIEKMDPRDPLIAVAGAKTGCCQNISSDGRMVVRHALTSPFGGIYRIMKGSDVWVAQAWAGITEGGSELIFDSIEWNSVYNPMIIMAFFKELADRIVESHPTIRRVVVGGGGNTPEGHGYPLLEKPYRPIIDFSFPMLPYGYDSNDTRYILSQSKNPSTPT